MLFFIYAVAALPIHRRENQQIGVGLRSDADGSKTNIAVGAKDSAAAKTDAGIKVAADVKGDKDKDKAVVKVDGKPVDATVKADADKKTTTEVKAGLQTTAATVDAKTDRAITLTAQKPVVGASAHLK